MNDTYYMQRCIDLALMGQGNVAPNPMVGAVIVHNNAIIGEGFHQHFGQAHAEVNAINAVENKSVLNQSTIYVSLEPCSHFGKTPPCADLLIQHQFKKVVIGCVDTFSKVSGTGIARLKHAGITVETGILEAECRELNKRFFTFHEKHRPFIVLKWAQTQDGFIDKNRTDGEKGINWITQVETKKSVHQWRAKEASIMVGKNTALIDNPSLTVREVKGRNPIRILIDSNLEVPTHLALFSEDSKTIVINTVQSDTKGHVEWIKVDALTPKSICEVLHQHAIQSVLIEGGKQLLESFIAANLWDEARILVGNCTFGEGLKAPIIHGTPTEKMLNECDKQLLYVNV